MTNVAIDPTGSPLSLQSPTITVEPGATGETSIAPASPGTGTVPGLSGAVILPAETRFVITTVAATPPPMGTITGLVEGYVMNQDGTTAYKAYSCPILPYHIQKNGKPADPPGTFRVDYSDCYYIYGWIPL